MATDASAHEVGDAHDGTAAQNVEWSGLAQRVFDELPPEQKRSVQLGALKISRAKSVQDEPKLKPLIGTDKFVLSVGKDTLRMVTQRTQGGWKVVDISRPAGGFSFAPLPSSPGKGKRATGRLARR
ncbi:hypothetical protein [Roseateles amylovorans]|uniref:Uncharacterized protein n=1 Tax=Roseateles amylovorans TaxID=2978473 RepID=A0ABY6AW77_9BURK|nr:hypothetical protein [Roseateles amylovorans]UXH76573.1 hypothetical protein N4261_16155 [Roseateles amylovorans]